MPGNGPSQPGRSDVYSNLVDQLRRASDEGKRRLDEARTLVVPRRSDLDAMELKLASARIRGESSHMVKDLSGSLVFTADETLGESFSTLDRRIRKGRTCGRFHRRRRVGQRWHRGLGIAR